MAHLLHAVNQPLTGLQCSLELCLVGSRTAATIHRRYARRTGAVTTQPTGILAAGTLTFNGNGTLIGPVDTKGKLINITNIPITNLHDGASNMTFNWSLLNGTTPVISGGGAPAVLHRPSKTAAAADLS